MKRIDWLDGIKGICCIFILIHHYILFAFPSAYMGINAVSKLNGLDTLFSQNPLSFIVNGNFLVCIFFVISAIIMTLQAIKAETPRKVANIIFKRYFRFALPIFVFCLFRHILLTILNLNSYSLIDLFKAPFYSIIWVGNNQYNSGFWVISFIFYGSFLSILTGLVIKSANKKILPLLYILAFIYFYRGTYLLCFVLGSIIAYYIYKNDKRNNIILGILFLIIGIIFGGYPTEFMPTNFYRYLYFDKINTIIPMHVFYHIVGAFFIVLSVLYLPKIQKLFSNKFFKFLGTISFAVYILHDQVLDLTKYLFNNFLQNYNYIFIIIVLLLFTILLTIFISWLFVKYIEKPLNKFINKLSQFFLEEDTTTLH